jgi:hypothetical protein
MDNGLLGFLKAPFPESHTVAIQPHWITELMCKEGVLEIMESPFPHFRRYKEASKVEG